ncbi:MAG: hypothetical protein H6Q90_3926, partial [Deltaproteobacteria bacterium]|nr:hypothetical protein [Deltaproteobacteria bacterium]
VRAPEIDEHPASIDAAELRVTRASVDIAMGIERDFAFGMTPEPDPALCREFLPLPSPATGDVVDHDPHATMVSSTAEEPREQACDDADREDPPPGDRPGKPVASRAVQRDR